MSIFSQEHARTLSALQDQKTPQVRTAIPGPKSQARWEEEERRIGPGLQAVVQWAKISFEAGEGSFLRDVDGNVFLDFMGGSGVNSIGH